MVTLGVIADTHIPDRDRALHPKVIPAFREVEAILHAGDISASKTLAQLESVAPVYAVRGNRDMFIRPKLPLTRTLDFGGATIGLTHGHGGMRRYVQDRLRYLFTGFQPLGYFHSRILNTFPEKVDVAVYGHTHYPVNLWVEGVLLFNPGSPWRNNPSHIPVSVGLLRIGEEGIEGEILGL